METYTEPKDLVDNPHYQEQRHRVLSGLSDNMIDVPIVKLINSINRLPYCFTLQSCYGHFVYEGQKKPHNLERLPVTDSIDKVQYRIAYVAVCIENGNQGSYLFESLKKITDINPENIQFCCAGWFWNRQVNSYALQVEPDRFKHQDKAVLNYMEALIIEKIRDEFFVRFQELVTKWMGEMTSTKGGIK